MSQVAAARFVHHALHRFPCTARRPQYVRIQHGTQCLRYYQRTEPRMKSERSSVKSTTAKTTTSAQSELNADLEPSPQPKKKGRPKKVSTEPTTANHEPKDTKGSMRTPTVADIFTSGELSEFEKIRCNLKANTASTAETEPVTPVDTKVDAAPEAQKPKEEGEEAVSKGRRGQSKNMSDEVALEEPVPAMSYLEQHLKNSNPGQVVEESSQDPVHKYDASDLPVEESAPKPTSRPELTDDLDPEVYPQPKTSPQTPYLGPVQSVPGRRDLELQVRLPPNFQPTNPVTLYLPFHSTTPIEPVFNSLSTAASTAIVIPTHKSSKPTPSFPTILHDAVAALHRTRALFPRSPIGVFGTGISGGLALSLAITEPSISVVAVHDPIIDLFTLGPVSWNKRLRQWRPATTKTPLSLLREKVFGPNPFWWTDKFASPLFFFRTPGVDIAEEEGKGVQKLKHHSQRQLDTVLRARFLVGYDKEGTHEKELDEFVRVVKRAWSLQCLRAYQLDNDAFGGVPIGDVVNSVSMEMVQVVDTTGRDGIEEVGRRLGEALRFAEVNEPVQVVEEEEEVLDEDEDEDEDGDEDEDEDEDEGESEGESESEIESENDNESDEEDERK